MITGIGRLVLQLKLAKSGWWCHTDEKEERAYLFSIHIMTQKKTEHNALSILLGPLSFTIGWAKK